MRLRSTLALGSIGVVLTALTGLHCDAGGGGAKTGSTAGNTSGPGSGGDNPFATSSGAGGLGEADWEVWGELEALHRDGRARAIGISNVGLAQLRELERAKIRPMIVQNRCYAERGWDRDVREYCLANGIAYEGFSLLTANPEVVEHPATAAIARRLGATPAQVVFRFAVSLGILPLTGTTDSLHMKQDLEALSLELSPADADALRAL